MNLQNGRDDVIIFVEHDAQGNIFHVCEVHTTEGRDVAPPKNEMTVKEKTQYQKSVDDAIGVRENATRSELVNQGKTKPLIVLPDGAQIPAANTHIVDMNSKTVRERTAAEKQAWIDAHKPPTS